MIDDIAFRGGLEDATESNGDVMRTPDGHHYEMGVNHDCGHRNCPANTGGASTTEREDLPRLKQMYVEGQVSLAVFEAMIDYYLIDCDGVGPTVLGRSIPNSVDSDVPPASRPEEHPGVAKYLQENEP